MPDHFLEKALLGLEVEIDRPFRDPGAGCDILLSGGRITVLDELLEGRVENFGGPFRFASGPFRFDFKRHFRCSAIWVTAISIM